MLKQNKRLVVFTAVVITILIVSSILPASAQFSQWRSLNPYRDGTLPIIGATAPPFLYSVNFLAADYGWAVGGDCDIYTLPIAPLGVPFAPACQAVPEAGGGFILLYDGAKWTNVLVPPGTATLTAVYAVSRTDAWAVGLANPAGATILHWDGTGWTRVTPPVGVGDLFGLHMLPGGTDGWAVGGGGAATVDNIRWSGTFPSGAWSPGPTPLLVPGAVARAVSFNSITLGWIVASNGNIFKWDGAGWLPEVSPVAVPLLSVHAVSATDAWAVGAGSTIIRWNGASWTGPMVAPTGATVDYRSIKMVSPTDGWIAGTLNVVTVEGMLLRWNGVAWGIVRSYITDNLNSVFMLPGGIAGWAVGDAETIVRWNNAQWISGTSPTAFPLFDLSMVSSADGWAVGGGGIFAPALGGSIFRWDGTHWFHYETLPTANALLGIHMLDSNNGWAVGSSAPGPPSPPAILRWNGVSWTVVSPPGVALGQTLADVYARSPTEAWAVGYDPLGVATAPILKWDGSIWASVPSGTPAGTVLARLQMLSPTDGWAVGCTSLACLAPVILRWNGLAWSTVTSPPGIAGLLDIYMLSPTDGWAVGNIAGGQGTIIHWDGIQWRRVPGPTAGFLTSVRMVSPTDGWTVGWDATAALSLIVHWNGLTWDVVSTPPVPSTMNNILTSVDMVTATDGWIVSGFSFVAGFGKGTGLFLHYGPQVIGETTTSTLTSITTATVTSTQTSTTSSTGTTTMTTPPGPGIPGYPTESILAGLIVGVAVLAVLRNRPRRRS